MLKKIMKAALAASLVFGMSSFAYAAEGKIGGSFKEYFGQYNSGADGYEAHFDNWGEGNLQFKGKAGKASVFFEVQSDTALENSDIQRKVSYVTPIGSLSIGTVVSIGVIPMEAGGGFKTSKVPASTRRALIVSGYKENDGIQLTVPLEGMGFVQGTMYSTGGNAISGGDGSAGNAIQLAANLNFGGIGVRFGYNMDTKDDPMNSGDGDAKSGSMLLGALVPLGETMSITFNYSSAKVTNYATETAADGTVTTLTSTADTDHTTTDIGLQMAVGPGKLYVGYDMWATKDAMDRANLHVMYDIGVGDGAGYQFAYISEGSTPEGGDTTTASTLLGGLYASF